MPPHETIALAAYYLWLNHGEQDAVTNWLAAEASLMAAIPDNNVPISADVMNVPAPPHFVR